MNGSSCCLYQSGVKFSKESCVLRPSLLTSSPRYCPFSLYPPTVTRLRPYVIGVCPLYIGRCSIVESPAYITPSNNGSVLLRIDMVNVSIYHRLNRYNCTCLLGVGLQSYNVISMLPMVHTTRISLPALK